MEPIWPLIGVAFGVILNILISFMSELRGKRQKLRIAAYKCLERLYAIEKVKDQKDSETFKNEKYHLGQEQIDYFTAISAFNTIKKKHWDISKRLRMILIDFKQDDIKTIINDLESLYKVNT